MKLKRLAVLMTFALSVPLAVALPLPDQLYKAPGFVAPYKPVLTGEEKVAGLSLFWAQARSSFVHFDHVPDLAWDQVYMDYLTKVIAAPTTRDYYRVMMQLAPLLQDGHTNIYPPETLAGELYSRPPLRTVLLEDKVLVERIGNPSLQGRLRVGEEVVAIDGEPALQYGRQHVEPFVSASTPQDRALRTYSYQLLTGAAGKPVTLRVRAEDGVERAHGGPAIGWTPVGSADETYQAKHEAVFAGPVAVLTGPQTFSAAEDFTVAFNLMKRGIVVGEATGGSTGQPLFFDLPGGGKARICVKRDVYPDGSAFVGKGVMPDVEVRRTVASLRAGTDPVLDRAIAELRK